MRFVLGISCFALILSAENWPQFRGPEGRGVAADDAKPPVEFGPAKRLLWKTGVPTGHSSACVWGDRIFITGFEKDGGKLHTIAIDRRSGAEVWRRTVTPSEIEKVHDVSSPATATPATDGERVYVYFGSYGVVAYGLDGKPAWESPLPLAKSLYGSGTSPLIAGDLIVIVRDYNPEPKVIGVSKKDGKVLWSTALEKKQTMSANTGHSTPAFWNGQIVLHRPGDVSGYSTKDGSRLWIAKLNTSGTSTPLTTPEMIFIAGYTNYGDPATPPLPTYEDLLAKCDANKDGKIALEEIPEDVYIMQRPGVPASVPGANSTLRRYFKDFDGNKDGFLEAPEWNQILTMMKMVGGQKHGLAAVKPEGTGDITAKSIQWIEHRNVSEVPAPLLYRDRVYMVMNGGVATCVDAKSGSLIYRGRIGSPGAYYSSPVAAGGHIYTASAEGVVTVLDAGNELSVLARNDLGEPVYATPAFIGKVAYIRSLNHLWAFGEK